MRALHLSMVLALVLMLTACSSSGKRERTETEVIDQYSALVRWSQYDALVDYMHPDWLEENPVTSLDLERLKQFRVTGYRVRQIVSVDEGNGVERVVQLRMYHFHTARERQIDYLESWRWDEEYERWMLHSGLPDVTQGR